MKALFIKDWKLLKNQGKMFGAVLVFYGLLAVMDNSMGQSILGFFPFLFGFFTISTVSYDEYQHLSGHCYTDCRRYLYRHRGACAYGKIYIY